MHAQLLKIALLLLGFILTSCGGGSGGGKNNPSSSLSSSSISSSSTSTSISSSDSTSTSSSISSSNSSSSASGNGETPSTLTLSGTDTAAIGTELTVNYLAYRPNFSGADNFVAATSSGVVLDFVRIAFNEVELNNIDVETYNTDVLNSVVFNVFDFGISMRINIDGNAWLYSLSCQNLSGQIISCENITIDTGARTVTIADAIVQPTLGGNANSLASAPLTINGTITWSLSDENPNAPLNYPSGNGSNNGGGNKSGLTLTDIVGVWDISTTEEDNTVDEYYAVITPDGSYIDYDYEGDTFSGGLNCYFRDAGTIVELGNGNFLIFGNTIVNFVASGNNLIGSAGSITTEFRPTIMVESNFTPLCN